SEFLNDIRAMCDVTNGGLRGDLYEINYEANCGVTIYEEEVRKLVNPNVLNLLKKVEVDYLGVSLDALLIYCSESISKKIISDLKSISIKCSEIGFVDDSKEVSMIYSDDSKKKILPRFRESAYTKVKQVVGEETPELGKEMETNIEVAADAALKKRKKIIDYIKNSIS
ncbi:MAG: AIR synthase-related protein, partial [Candidatus Thorarchaeota archaeon]